jgi:subtilisin family serine protease
MRQQSDTKLLESCHIKGGVPLFEWRPDAPVEDIFEGVTSADEHEVFIEDVFEFPDDDVDADHSDDVENGLDEVNNDTPGDDFIDINNHNVANANEADDPAEFGPDGLEPGANDESGYWRRRCFLPRPKERGTRGERESEYQLVQSQERPRKNV